MSDKHTYILTLESKNFDKLVKFNKETNIDIDSFLNSLISNLDFDDIRERLVRKCQSKSF